MSLQGTKILWIHLKKINSNVADLLNNIDSTSLDHEKLEQSESALERIKKHDLRELDRDIEVALPDKSLRQLKQDAETLLKYLEEGHELPGPFFNLKAFLPREIKERLYFIDECKVNGSPCDTKEEFQIALRDFDIRLDLEELAKIWNVEVPEEKLLSDRRKYYELIHSVAKYRKVIAKAEEYLNHGNFHPIKKGILNAFKRIDHSSYDEALTTAKKLTDDKNRYQDFVNLKENIGEVCPKILSSIRSGNFSKQDLPGLEQAILFRHAKNEIEKRTDVDDKQLWDDIKELENEEKESIAKLAAKKAWFKVVERLKQNPELSRSLTAWAKAVSKIGKTSRGKKAMKNRRTAQKYMEDCKDSIPCWIMPLYKVAETVQPKPEMYDYVIVDEASQLGPDAIFLLYISKKVIIAGDDKQTSPEYIGVGEGSVTSLINKHLQGIPYSGSFETDYSFFDIAEILCSGVTTVLREHFRCMPEIIEFCNKHFYAPNGKSLYPVKQYSEKRLKPLVSIFCNKGYTEGKEASITNEPEAEEIAETIERLVHDESYDGKTFGVITLQGSQQSRCIENLLLNRIGPEEFHKRKIVCGNAAAFQGDERDIIFLSLVTAHNHRRSSLVKTSHERRFNVAVSRAEEQIWLFHSVQLDDLTNKEDLRYKLLDHFKNYKSPQQPICIPIEKKKGKAPKPFGSWFEVEVYNDLVRGNLIVTPQYKVASGKYRIDLVSSLPNGVKIAIECDGDKWHGLEQRQHDIGRQNELERHGWQFFRVRGFEYYANRVKTLEPLWKMISRLEDSDTALDQSSSAQEDGNAGSPETFSPAEEIVHENANSNREDEFNHSEHENTNISSDEAGALRYFNLYKSGTYILTTDNKRSDADYTIKITSKYQDGYLLQCYDSGHINKVRIKWLLSKKVEKEYKNGLSTKEKLSCLKLIESEEIIGICFNENGRKKFKAHLTQNISAREQLHLQGWKVIYNSNFEKIRYRVLPLKIHDDIKRLVFQSFMAKGKSIGSNYYQSEWAIIKPYFLNKRKLLYR